MRVLRPPSSSILLTSPPTPPPPSAVTSAPQVGHLLVYSCLPAGLLAVFASFSVRSSLPPTPPCASSSSHPPPFFQSVKRLVRSRSFWMLLQQGGCGIGIFSALLTMLQQSLCVKGFSASFSGACGAGAIAAGLIVSVVVGAVVDKKAELKGKLEEIVKVKRTGWGEEEEEEEEEEEKEEEEE